MTSDIVDAINAIAQVLRMQLDGLRGDIFDLNLIVARIEKSLRTKEEE